MYCMINNNMYDRYLKVKCFPVYSHGKSSPSFMFFFVKTPQPAVFTLDSDTYRHAWDMVCSLPSVFIVYIYSHFSNRDPGRYRCVNICFREFHDSKI